MSEDRKVELTIDDGLAVITMNNPKTSNALGMEAARDLREAAIACSMNSAVRAVLLRSEGKNFCAGGDMAFIGKQTDRGAAIRDLTIDFHAAMQILAKMDAPLITAVQGAAAGAGLSMVAASDYAIGAQGSFFAFAYTALGFSGDGGLTWTLPRIIGVREFQKLVLTGRRVTSEEALRLGILSEVVPDEELAARSLEFAKQVASGPTRAYGQIRRLLAGSLGNSFEEQLEAESVAISNLARSEDSGNAIAALFAKEKIVFKNR